MPFAWIRVPGFKSCPAFWLGYLLISTRVMRSDRSARVVHRSFVLAVLRLPCEVSCKQLSVWVSCNECVICGGVMSMFVKWSVYVYVQKRRSSLIVTVQGSEKIMPILSTHMAVSRSNKIWSSNSTPPKSSIYSRSPLTINSNAPSKSN